MKSEGLALPKARSGSVASPGSGAGFGPGPGGMMTLVEVNTGAANGIDEEKPEEWEEMEFLVDGGASATVIGPDSVKAVNPSDPNWFLTSLSPALR